MRATAQSSPTPRQVVNYRAETLFGEVDSAGRVTRGDGYTVEKQSGSGSYRMTFKSPFSGSPVVLVTAQGYGVCYAPAHEVTPSSAVVRCLSDLLTATPVETDLDFSFYAGVSHWERQRGVEEAEFTFGEEAGRKGSEE